MLGFLKGRPEHPRIGQIRQLHLFATLGPRELRVIDGFLHERHYLKDEVIFDEGEEGQALYVVLSGRVLICRPGAPDGGHWPHDSTERKRDRRWAAATMQAVSS